MRLTANLSLPRVTKKKKKSTGTTCETNEGAQQQYVNTRGETACLRTFTTQTHVYPCTGANCSYRFTGNLTT